ncbi:MAG: transglutaminase-like domain-containing protein [Euryarchaeota archaeon]|nr:transglutaminase-like domain-containing protein [Euryarchaeota archaeon]
MKKKHCQTTCLIIIIIINIVLISGCLHDDDPIVTRAQPYLNEINLNDVELRAQAVSIVSGCPAGDKECQVNMIYRYVVENYKYYSDPRTGEFIQSPAETMQIQGGDCEDLTIVLESLLENLGIKTYFVLTPDHAYCLACGINTENLWQYIQESILIQASKDLGQNQSLNVIMDEGNIFIVQEKQQTFILQPGEIFYYGGDGSNFNSTIKYMNIQYNITSSVPLSLYVVPSEKDYELMITGREFATYPLCNQKNFLKVSDSCDGLENHGGLILENDNNYMDPNMDAIVDVDMKFYFCYSPDSLFDNQEIVYYRVNDQDCIVLDPTAGKYGYPGFNGNPEGKKIAIDPISKEYFYLD